MAKLFSLRFDVDTHRCVQEGVPALSALGRSLDAPFTFFVNMGRAVDRGAILRRNLDASEAATLARARAAMGKPAAKLSARAKLGTRGWLRVALANPRVGADAPDVIRAAVAAGHEVGLHGGRNHGAWQRWAPEWEGARVADEIDAVLPTLAAVIGGPPAGFASPGWATAPDLPAILAERGVKYLADLHGFEEEDAGRAAPVGIPSVRTALTGEPGGVAYLEHLRALGLRDREIERRFEEDLERAGPVAAMYDHPYFAGIHELELIRRLVGIARRRGYEVVPLRAVAEALP